MNKDNKYLIAEKALTELLDLKRIPVGIKFLKTKEEYEAADGIEPISGLPYCSAVSKAGKIGRAHV